MADKLYNVKLTLDELLLLDNKCNSEVQKEVDNAKRVKMLINTELTEPEARFINDIIQELSTNGKLIFRYVGLNHDSYSGKSCGYAQYTRRSRYHHRGEIDYSKPIPFNGYEFADRCVRMTGYANLGCSKEFYEKIKSKLLEHLKDIKGEIPKEITGHEPRWKKYDKRKCNKCGWTGNEKEMGRSPCIMEGTYPSTCPKCGAKNQIFQKDIVEIIPGFELVETKGENNGTT